MGEPVRTSPRDIARRIRILIARQDRGDVTAAARRLGLPIDDVFQLEAILAVEGESLRRTALLAAILRRYDTDACWLLTGRNTHRLADLPTETRLEVARLLSEIGARIVAEHREQRRPPG